MLHSLLLISITPEGTETLYYLNRTLEGIKELYHLNRTLRKYLITLPFKQNAEKVSEAKKEHRRRTTATSRCSWWSIWCLIRVLKLRRGALDESIWCLILYNQQNAEKVSETKREGRRRTTATSRPSRWSIWCLIHVLLYFGLTVLQYSPQSPPASHCLYRYRWA